MGIAFFFVKLEGKKEREREKERWAFLCGIRRRKKRERKGEKERGNNSSRVVN